MLSNGLLDLRKKRFKKVYLKYCIGGGVVRYGGRYSAAGQSSGGVALRWAMCLVGGGSVGGGALRGFGSGPG